MLKLKELSKSYGHQRGIKDVSLTIEPGKLYLFVGENGSGKSTTIKLISKVIYPKKGSGQIFNQFQRIIYLPDRRTYPKLLTIETYLSYYLNGSVTKLRIREMMERYSLENKMLGALSKGMQQKVGVIQTILSPGDLYLLDEPLDGLDKETVRVFMEDAQGLLTEGKAIVISTHNKTAYKDLKPVIYSFKEGICNERKSTSTRTL